jgi:hypothetical protein
MKYDFSGYATKNNVKCSDGRTIKKDAFKDNDGQTVPLVWQHMHNEPTNILGHAVLENREDGTYAYGFFNTTPAGVTAKTLVLAKDIVALSIYANQLEQEGKNVIHGAIREVSLVMAGANPGALIDNLNFAHADGSNSVDEEEAIIFTGLQIKLEEEVVHAEPKKEVPPVPKEDKTVQDIINELTDEQKNVVFALLADAEEAGAASVDPANVEHSDEGEKMKTNVFEGKAKAGNTLSHSEFALIAKEAMDNGITLKNAFIAHEAAPGTDGERGVDYGIGNLSILFPDATNVTNPPTFITRNMEWVGRVLSGTKHSPFSRIKSMTADITADEARAKGYITGNFKKAEVFSLLQRVTTPQTIYKKQKLDRDDIIDITTLDVVSWMKAEMRVMLNEEIARAVLIGDGRDVISEDKIKEANVRPIYTDDNLYSHHISISGDLAVEDMMDQIIRSMEHYKGSGSPTLFLSTSTLADMMLVRDKMGRRLYSTKSELAGALLVSDIVDVNILNDLVRTVGEGPAAVEMTLVGIIVNLKDYTIGADRGGEINLFDDFDIDYNQYKYLLETRISGALTLPKSALVIETTPPTPPVGE